jgi:C-terminal processing protease CtpA/Prc
MRVLKHDGSRHHGVGISPTINIEPTIKGIRDGKDEVLEKAIETAEKNMK